MANRLQGISVALPLTYDRQDGPYYLNKTLKEVVKQNLKNLVLTSPGERIMVPNFGAGIRRFLFESYTADTFENISMNIRSQASRYMPFLKIEGILLKTSDEDPTMHPNSVHLTIEYSVEGISERDTLLITQANN